MKENEIRSRLFLCLLFANTPLKTDSLIKIATKDEIDKNIGELRKVLSECDLPIMILETAGGFRIGSDPYYDDFIREFFRREKRVRLSKASLDVLTIIAYKQPVTISEINQIRAIHSEGPVKTLLEKDLIEIKGRKDSIGRPLLFKTTGKFLEIFGINSLEDLPESVEINMLKQGMDNEDN